MDRCVTDPVRTVCPYCGVGCGIEVSVGDDGGIALRGDPGHPANWSRLCAKGSALAETVAAGTRLSAPRVDGKGCSWDQALDRVASGFAQTVREHGPDAVAFYASGQLLTEDYYVANKLMKGFIGSGNIDTNSRLCMSSSVAGHVRAFGEDIVPGCYDDLEAADLVILAGSNAAWCHPVLYQRIMNRTPRPRVVVIDPRRTASAQSATLHLPLAPGSDVALWNGLLNDLRTHGVLDLGFLERHTEGLGDAVAVAHRECGSIPQVAVETGLSEDVIAQFFRLFATHEKVVTLYSQGVNQASSGSDKVNAIINCHLATGRIGRPGMGPFSLTGQPNAMGGREVGGLANQLAAHMGFIPEEIDRVRRFWNAPRIAAHEGLKAVDLFDAIDRGTVRAVWIMATNPVDSLPDADRARAALARCPLVVVSDCVADSDTAMLAHCLLPAQGWGEKDGTVTNSERRISRQRPFLKSAPGAKPDWQIVAQVAARMGFGDAFAYQRPADIFREHAALSGFENQGARLFDISVLSRLSDEAYDRLEPVQWPVQLNGAGTVRLCGDGCFPTAGGRARLIPVAARPPVGALTATYPLALNTGRVRDHWHTMTRTGLSPRLSRHSAAPYIEIHPQDAIASGISHGKLTTVSTAHGRMVARAMIDDRQRRGTVFVPIHWNDQYAYQGRVGALVNPAVDPLSGQPELKHTPARVDSFDVPWQAVAFSRSPLDLKAAAYWVRAREGACWRYELASGPEIADPRGWAQALFRGDVAEPAAEYWDPVAGSYRVALLRRDVLQACLYVERAHLPWPAADVPLLFLKEALTPADRLEVLARVLAAPEQVICACFATTDRAVREAVCVRGLHTVEAIGRSLAAGTRCGSCLPELEAVIEAATGWP